MFMRLAMALFVVSRLCHAARNCGTVSLSKVSFSNSVKTKSFRSHSFSSGKTGASGVDESCICTDALTEPGKPGKVGHGEPVELLSGINKQQFPQFPGF